MEIAILVLLVIDMIISALLLRRLREVPSPEFTIVLNHTEAAPLASIWQLSPYGAIDTQEIGPESFQEKGS